MSDSDPSRRREDPSPGDPLDPLERTDRVPRRTWILILLGFLLILVVIFGYMLIVSEAGTEDENEIYNRGPGSVSVAAVVDEPVSPFCST